MKEFFSLDEASTYLSPTSGVAIVKADLLRFCEEGRLPISFKYRGGLGFFQAYSAKAMTAEILFPKPIRTVYFNGYLTSANPCRLSEVITTIRSLGRGRGLEESTTVQNTLRPHAVEILKYIHCDPGPADVDLGAAFWGRLRESDGGLDSWSPIPEIDWIVHISQLRAIESLWHKGPSAVVGQDMPKSFIPRVGVPGSSRIAPEGGDSITPLIWEICSDLRDEGKKRVTALPVMAVLKSLASSSSKRHPLLGVVTGGVKYEYEKGIEEELDDEKLRHRIRVWREAHQYK